MIQTMKTLKKLKRSPSAALISAMFILTGCEGDTSGVRLGGQASDSNQPQTNLIFAPAAAIAEAQPPSSTFTELSLDGETLTLDELQGLMFVPYCSSCHTGGGDSLPASMNFTSAADTYVSTVGTTSTEDPRLSIIEPEQATNSYLIRKLEGTQSVGQSMPLGGDPLPGWIIDAVKRWIDDGAVY